MGTCAVSMQVYARMCAHAKELHRESTYGMGRGSPLSHHPPLKLVEEAEWGREAWEAISQRCHHQQGREGGRKQHLI